MRIFVHAARAAALLCVAAPAAVADHTRNIMITGYWPPTNEIVRPFSTSPAQNPGGWQGGNWEGRGYDIYSFFPEFPSGIGKGEGDFEVDYQDTSEDFWRIVAEVKPVAIMTFSRGSAGKGWELEYRSRNLDQWIDDYEAPFQPTPSPPDPTLPAGAIRYSSLPMLQIRDAVRAAGIDVNPFIDFSSTSFGGGFVSEFMAYHGTWYKDMNDDPDAAFRCYSAGHIHVGTGVSVASGRAALDVSLREMTRYLDLVIPAPGPWTVLLGGTLIAARRRRG